MAKKRTESGLEAFVAALGLNGKTPPEIPSDLVLESVPFGLEIYRLRLEATKVLSLPKLREGLVVPRDRFQGFRRVEVCAEVPASGVSKHIGQATLTYSDLSDNGFRTQVGEIDLAPGNTLVLDSNVNAEKIRIESGASLVVNGDLTVTDALSLHNSATIIVAGKLTVSDEFEGGEACEVFAWSLDARQIDIGDEGFVVVANRVTSRTGMAVQSPAIKVGKRTRVICSEIFTEGELRLVDAESRRHRTAVSAETIRVGRFVQEPHTAVSAVAINSIGTAVVPSKATANTYYPITSKDRRISKYADHFPPGGPVIHVYKEPGEGFVDYISNDVSFPKGWHGKGWGAKHLELATFGSVAVQLAYRNLGIKPNNGMFLWNPLLIDAKVFERVAREVMEAAVPRISPELLNQAEGFSSVLDPSSVINAFESVIGQLAGVDPILVPEIDSWVERTRSPGVETFSLPSFQGLFDIFLQPDSHRPMISERVAAELTMRLAKATDIELADLITTGVLTAVSNTRSVGLARKAKPTRFDVTSLFAQRPTAKSQVFLGR